MKKYLAILFLIVSINSYSQNTLKFDILKGSPRATLNEVSWISGYWIGEALGGITEEVWTNPLGDSMMGSFKLVVDGKVKFYELCTISEENETIILRIKHFNRDLKGWEEKDETENFALVKIEPNKVYFNQLTFERVDDNHLTIYVVFKNDSGKEEEMKFPYKLKN